MRSIATSGICAVVSLLALGCTNRDSQSDGRPTGTAPVSTDAPTPAKTSDFAVRFDAASALTSDALRQEAFAKLAIDAATAGESDVARKSLAAIQSDAVREESAYKCAMLLAKAGKGKDALAIAKSIASDAQREKALAKIAKGDLAD